MAPAVRALRGATTVDVDTPEHIEERVVALLDTMLARNDVDHDDLISILFTATEDVVSTFPATAARKSGLGDVPLICARELEIDASMPMVVRMLAHVETDLVRSDVTHVYLHGAAALRRDLNRVRAVPDD